MKIAMEMEMEVEMEIEIEIGIEIEIEIMIKKGREIELNRECPAKRPQRDTAQELSNQGQEVVQVIEGDDAAAINVQQGSRWRRLVSSGERNGPIDSD